MAVQEFVFSAHPSRVIFGSGVSRRLAEELARLGVRRALVLSTDAQRGQAEALAARLGDAVAGVFAGAVMHTPVAVSESATELARSLRADVLVAVGGGSTTGLGKAIALRTALPQIVLPTTYSGSEMTPIIGETADGIKKTQTTQKVLPEVVIYDVDLTLDLPPALSGTSGVNAIAHAVEALYARDCNPVIAALALEAIGALARSLPVIVREPRNLDARADALYGAWLCGICLGSVGMALHHKLCHVLGGRFDLPHAEAHTIVLPHALSYNAPIIPDVMHKLEGVLGGEPCQALYDLGQTVGAPGSLSALGMPESGIEEATAIALANPYWNPRPLERDAIRDLIARAHAGVPPVAEWRKPK